MILNLAVLPGDGIGTEVLDAAMKVLAVVAAKTGHTIHATHGDIGWAGLDKTGSALPPATRELCAKSDAILFGRCRPAGSG